MAVGKQKFVCMAGDGEKKKRRKKKKNGNSRIRFQNGLSCRAFLRNLTTPRPAPLDCGLRNSMWWNFWLKYWHKKRVWKVVFFSFWKTKNDIFSPEFYTNETTIGQYRTPSIQCYHGASAGAHQLSRRPKLGEKNCGENISRCRRQYCANSLFCQRLPLRQVKGRRDLSNEGWYVGKREKLRVQEEVGGWGGKTSDNKKQLIFLPLLVLSKGRYLPI